MEANPEIVDSNIGAADNNIWKIMIGVFTSPVNAFGRFNQSPKLIIPIIVTIILGGFMTGLIAKQQAMLQYNMMKKSTVIPQEVFNKMREDAENANPLKSGAIGGAAIVAFGILSPLLAWFIGSVIFGGSTKFKKIWGVYLLGGLIALIGGLLKAPLVIAKDSTYVSMGLSVLLPGKDFTSFIYYFLYTADLFVIWSVIVTGIGLATIYDFPRGRGITISAITCLVWVTLGFVPIMLMSFAGVEISFF
jgi:hypothetical protein